MAPDARTAACIEGSHDATDAEVTQLKGKLWALTESTFTAILIATGDKLGLYATLRRAGPLSSAELAMAASLPRGERWVREWLYQQAASGLVRHVGGGRFALDAAAAEVLVDAEGRHGEIGLFPALQAMASAAAALPEAFASGEGLSYDRVGDALAEGLERLHLPVARFSLVQHILPHLSDGGDAARMGAAGGRAAARTRRAPAGGERTPSALLPRLAAGGLRVADVGCGGGMNLIELAKAFPQNEFHGFELSTCALARARANTAAAAAAGYDMSAVTWHDVSVPGQSLAEVAAGGAASGGPPSRPFDFVLCYDVLHDMAFPRQLMRDVRAALDPTKGVWLAVDIQCSDRFEDNIEDAGAAVKFGFSLMLCMSSGLSQPGGEGLGTLGLHTGLARRWLQAAGFGFVRPFKVPQLPTNSFFEVRV